jgi:hypothetical protein
MDYSIIDERAAATIKEILRFAKTFVFKDTDQADAHESTTSILWGSYFISACEGTLPYIDSIGKKGFPNPQLQDYNIIPNGVEFFQQIYLQNSLYIGSNMRRLEEVRRATPMQNAELVDAPFIGNVFEANSYYRLLFCNYGVLPNIARQTPDHGILYYDPEDFYYSDTEYETDSNGNYILDGDDKRQLKKISFKYLDKTKFIKLYNENRNLFTAAMENRAMRWDPNYTTFVNWMIVVMTIYSYLDSELEKIYNIALYDQYDIRNALYSFGINFLDDLPEPYQLRVIKNIRELVRTKSTSQTLKIVIQDIFGRELVDAYKLYMVYGDPNLMCLGSNPSEDGDYGTGNKELFFVEIPFDVANPLEYIVAHPEINKQSFADVTGADPYWKNCPESEVIEKIRAEFGDGMVVLPSKYIGISNDINMEEQNDGAILLFSLLHYISPSAVSIPSFPELHLGSTPLVYALMALYYLETAISDMTTEDMSPNWKTQPSIFNIIGGEHNTAWHVLSFITSIDALKIPENYKAVYFSKLTSADGRTLWKEISDTLELLNTVSGPESLSAMMTSIIRINRELKKLFFFVSEQQDAISGKLVETENNQSVFVGDAIASGFQLEAPENSSKTVTEKVFEDRLRNEVPYPLHGKVVWDDQSYDTYSREAGFTEFVEYKILRGIYEDVFLKSNTLPSSIYFGAESVADVLKGRAPTLFRIIEESIAEGTGRARSVFSYLANEILAFLEDGGLEPGAVSFDTYAKGYLAEFASMLVEKFISYTVQLQVSGTKLKADGSGEGFIGLFDHLSKLPQHMILSDSFYGLSADRETAPYNPEGSSGYLSEVQPESSQMNPIDLPVVLDGTSEDYLPVHDIMVGMEMYVQIIYRPDRYGIISNSFGMWEFDTDEELETRPAIWKWESFAPKEEIFAYILHA